LLFILLATGCDGLGSTGSLSTFRTLFTCLFIFMVGFCAKINSSSSSSSSSSSVVKHGGQGLPGHVKPPKCFGRLKKLVLPFIFDRSHSSLMMWNLQSYPTTVLNERIWHFLLGEGFKTYSDPSYLYSGGSSPAKPPWIYAGYLVAIKSIQ